MAQLHAFDGRHHAWLWAGNAGIVRSCFQAPARNREIGAERSPFARPSTDPDRPGLAMRGEQSGFPAPEARLRAIANGDIEPNARDRLAA
jgi:hypothetical protein